SIRTVPPVSADTSRTNVPSCSESVSALAKVSTTGRWLGMTARSGGPAVQAAATAATPRSRVVIQAALMMVPPPARLAGVVTNVKPEGRPAHQGNPARCTAADTGYPVPEQRARMLA